MTDASTSFTVTVTFASLEALVSRFGNNAGVASRLNAKLRAAASARNADARRGQLRALEAQVEAQTGKALRSHDATMLLRLVVSLR